MGQSRVEDILENTIAGSTYNGLPQSRVEELLIELNTKIRNMSGASFIAVDELPTSNIDMSAIYLVPTMTTKTVYFNSTDNVCYIQTSSDPLIYAKFNGSTGKYIEDVTGLEAEAVSAAISGGTYPATTMIVEYGKVDGTKDEYICLDNTSTPVRWERIGSTSISIDLSDYLTKAEASSTYLSQSNAASTYLSQSDAATNYLTKTDASSTYPDYDDFTAMSTQDIEALWND